MMAASAFSSNFVSSVEDFQALFAPNSGDRLLLCHEAIRDDVTAAGLTAFEDAVGAAVATHAVNVRLHIWDCSSGAFAAARQQLGKETGAPLLLVVYQQTIADTFSKPLPALTQDVAASAAGGVPTDHRRHIQ
ncbi:hypothetical protein DQ04_02811040 [Trypanosoma grayi]|uniref:hypothetical protein n=1 Tax=Trypanosoma grayi TaxID=71804 RepID=UPI0004F46675|nr:hypothetical protein DQ04_02811040 [Trypanosoma grayi]KEG11251.1 hypothetical protein DQ04_02811040 [Trypanosoma grayi]